MNKSELIDAIATKTGQTKTGTEQTLIALVETIIDTVAQGDSVALVSLGTFKAAHRAAREGRNPATGEPLSIKASTLPKFVPSATFKAKVKGQ
jgi:DNA-binding protein HU-beta